MKKLRAIVKGRVQGVGFRYFVVRNASPLGITGYARNLPDGTVEVVAEGEKPGLDELLVSLNSGPSYSIVEDVRVEWIERPEKEYDGFLIKY